jgi:hypothetical protein
MRIEPVAEAKHPRPSSMPGEPTERSKADPTQIFLHWASDLRICHPCPWTSLPGLRFALACLTRMTFSADSLSAPALGGLRAP